MPKITNITSDEREQAIYTIGKLGEEVTDERIEYYVQLRRNTVKHQEEKANRNKREEIQKEWRSNTKKEGNEDVVKKAIRLAKIAFWLGVILVILPFFITGFGFGWLWYLIIVGIAFFTACLWGEEGKTPGAYAIVKTIFVGFCVLGCFMFLWGPLNPNYERSGGSSTIGFSSSEDSDEVMVYKGEKMHKVHLKCAKCDMKTYYWKSESSSLTLSKPDRMFQGEWYCFAHYPD